MLHRPRPRPRHAPSRPARDPCSRYWRRCRSAAAPRRPATPARRSTRRGPTPTGTVATPALSALFGEVRRDFPGGAAVSGRRWCERREARASFLIGEGTDAAGGSHGDVVTRVVVAARVGGTGRRPAAAVGPSRSG